ncbi:MAG: tRNA pseudouridine(13) synthase TruD [Candidatus Diapherotrites archaeon]|nr:tRNA pseudouridine(13) synthase TruD [Candidatus Diapherotrites archaeon]
MQYSDLSKQFGIEHYSTTCKGIGGRIKYRYADFIVEEVDFENKLCKARRFIKEKIPKEKSMPKLPKKMEKDYLHLDLEKINKDLNFVIKRVARFLGISRKRIGYAGLKDKRSVSCQRISIYRPNIERLRELKIAGVAFHRAKESNERIELGMLKGNLFTVTIRNIKLEREEIEKRIKRCFNEAKQGIANYFGEQRFGSMRAITHIIGRELIKGNFEKAVKMYLTTTFDMEKEEIKNARKKLAKDWDFKKALREFPKECLFERAMLDHLSKYPRDFVGAFQKMPKAMRYLFTHAFQSYLFNKVVSERIAQGIGLKPVDGDICKEGIATAPLYGYECKLAKGIPGKIEKQVLKDEGLKLSDFRVKSFPEISSKGARRKIIFFPKRMKLIEIKKDEFFDDAYKAKISFYLPKGCYATVLLREIMKN